MKELLYLLFDMATKMTESGRELYEPIDDSYDDIETINHVQTDFTHEGFRKEYQRQDRICLEQELRRREIDKKEARKEHLQQLENARRERIRKFKEQR